MTSFLTFWKYHTFGVKYQLKLRICNVQINVTAPRSQNTIAPTIFLTQNSQSLQILNFVTSLHPQPPQLVSKVGSVWGWRSVLWGFLHHSFPVEPHTGHFSSPTTVLPSAVSGYWPIFKALDKKCCASLNCISAWHAHRLKHSWKCF